MSSIHSSNYRERCIAEKGEICFNCGSEDNILIHHIDGNRNNNELDNLIPVCRTCHGKIHSKKDKLQEWTEKLGPGGDTSIRVSEELADELFDRKQRGESYEDVIWRLIEQSETGDDG